MHVDRPKHVLEQRWTQIHRAKGHDQLTLPTTGSKHRISRRHRERQQPFRQHYHNPRLQHRHRQQGHSRWLRPRLDHKRRKQTLRIIHVDRPRLGHRHAHRRPGPPDRVRARRAHRDRGPVRLGPHTHRAANGGQKFRLLFLTDDESPTSSDIDVYNEFVQA